jgi:hypothetical protein
VVREADHVAVHECDERALLVRWVLEPSPHPLHDFGLVLELVELAVRSEERRPGAMVGWLDGSYDDITGHLVIMPVGTG